MRNVAVIGLLLFAGIAGSCFQRQYCEELLATAHDPAVQTTMRTWANTFEAEGVSVRDVDSHDGVVPGLRWVDHQIDNELFRFGSNGHVRLVGPSPIDERDDTIGESVASLMFTERSRTGILVKLPTKTDFGDQSGTLVMITDDIAVLCEP